VPIEAHVLVAADSYDAMTSVRPYRLPLTRDEAVAELLDKAGAQFHPLVARAFAALLQGEPLRARLSESELADFRRSFSRVPVAAVPGREFVAEPRLLTMAAFVSTLVTIGIPDTPAAVSFALAGMTACLLCYWVGTQLRLRTRRSRAQTAITAGAAPELVVDAAGFAGWTAFATADGDDVQDMHRVGVPSAELREVQSWLRLGPAEQVKRLSSGTWVIRSQRVEHERRLVLGLQRRPRVYELELAKWLAETILTSLPPRRPAPTRRVEGERALALIELRAFDRLRRGAGQLVAERVIDEAERRIRSALRTNDAVVRVGDDVLAVSMIIGGTGLETLQQRLRDAVATVPVPQRLEALQPRVVVARAGDAHRVPELAEIESLLLPAHVTA
jgi:GGDEF domain-containing protein